MHASFATHDLLMHLLAIRMPTPETVTNQKEGVKPKRPLKFIRVLVLLPVIYLLAMAAVFVGQRNLLYFPYRQTPEDALVTAKRVGLEPWESGGKLIGWKKLSSASGLHDRVLITHGNAGSAIDRIDYASALNLSGPRDVYLLEYPGYGPLPGSPSQQSFFSRR